jgi:hypothetical protein
MAFGNGFGGRQLNTHHMRLNKIFNERDERNIKDGIKNKQISTNSFKNKINSQL